MTRTPSPAERAERLNQDIMMQEWVKSGGHCQLYVYLHIHVYVCIYIYMYIYTYVYIYDYIYTYYLYPYTYNIHCIFKLCIRSSNYVCCILYHIIPIYIFLYTVFACFNPQAQAPQRFVGSAACSVQNPPSLHFSAWLRKGLPDDQFVDNLQYVKDSTTLGKKNQPTGVLT